MRLSGRKYSPALSLLALVLFAWGCTDSPTPVEPALSPRPALLSETGQPTDQHIVLTGGKPSSDFAAAVSALGGRIETSHDAIGVFTVSGLSDAAAAELERVSDVKGVARDYVVQWLPPTEVMNLEVRNTPSPATDQSTAGFFTTFQWNMKQIDANDAWLVTDQGQGALVCILDTGIDPTHLDLIGNVDFARSTSFVPSEPDILDRNFHGTFVSALVTSNGFGIGSVAPDARLCAVKVLSATGSGAFDWVISGIMHATDVGADVMNLSLGAYFYSKDPGGKELIEALQRAINYAKNNGTLVVASSGNNGLNLDSDTPDWIHVPSQLQEVLSVGATGPFAQMNFDERAPYSNYGTTGVDLTAPGGRSGPLAQDRIISACSQFTTIPSLAACKTGPNFYALSTGTSFAAPHVSGAAAVYATNTATAGSGNQDLVKRYDAGNLAGCLIKGVDRIDIPNMDIIHGAGRLNVLKTMLCGSSPK